MRGNAETPSRFEENTHTLLLLNPDYLPLDVMRKRSGSGGGGGGGEEEGGGGRRSRSRSWMAAGAGAESLAPSPSHRGNSSSKKQHNAGDWHRGDRLLRSGLFADLVWRRKQRSSSFWGETCILDRARSKIAVNGINPGSDPNICPARIQLDC